MKVIAARVCVHVEHLTGEKQVLNLFRAHRFRVHLANVDTAGGDDGLGDRTGRRNRQMQRLQLLQQGAPLLPRNFVHLFARIDAGQRNKRRDELLWQKRVKCIDKIAVGVFGKIAQQPAVERFGRQRGLEIDIQLAWISAAQDRPKPDNTTGPERRSG